MYVIRIGGVDVVIGIQWLRTLGAIYINYNVWFMRFDLEGIQYELKELKYTPSQIIISHRMENLLKNICTRVIARIYSTEVKHEDENIPNDLKHILEKHHRVLQDIPKWIITYQYHENQLELIPRRTRN